MISFRVWQLSYLSAYYKMQKSKTLEMTLIVVLASLTHKPVQCLFYSLLYVRQCLSFQSNFPPAVLFQLESNKTNKLKKVVWEEHSFYTVTSWYLLQIVLGPTISLVPHPGDLWIFFLTLDNPFKKFFRCLKRRDPL